MSSFALDLRKFAEKVAEKADAVVKASVIGVAAEIDKRSPVGNPTLWKNKPPKGYVGGSFRANWQLGVGSLPQGVLSGVDPSGSNTQARIVAGIADDAAGKVYYIANNLPYARRLEYGYSTQAPAGMVGVTALLWQDKVRDAVEALS